MKVEYREKWEKIPNTDNHFISNLGRVLSLADGVPRFQTGSPNHKGYIRIKIDSTQKSYLLHRLVADVFLDKPMEGQTQINHKNGNKQDNRVFNLEWCTPSENLQHSYDKLGRIPAALGKKWTDEQRKRLSIALKGRTMPESWRENMRKSHIGKFCLGDNPRALKTICLETGEIFSCGKEAAMKYGVRNSTISQSIHKGTAIAGKFHFSQIKE